MDVELRLLGPVELVVAGENVQLRRRQERCLLAILGMDPGRLVSVDRVVDLLWDGQPPDRARASVQAMVSHLRSALRAEQPGGARLVGRGDGYALEVDAEAVDVHRFRTLVARARSAPTPQVRVELLAAALRLWRGAAMADALPAGGDRGRWCADLDELHLAAREEWLRARLECGEHGQLVEPLTRLVEEHPLGEHLRGLLMVALYRSGRRADALEVYQQVRRVLRAELGMEPGLQLQRLQVAILNDEPELSVAGWPRFAPAQLPADVAAFAGRDRQLAELDRLLTGGESGRAVVVTAIGGTAGVGKTALAVHWAHRVAARFPDGQLYVNLRGFDPSGRVTAPGEAICGFLDALGVPAERIPTGLEAQVGLYRSVLANKRLLILLDNARDTDQVRPLLPAAPGCLVVVTSRNQLTGLVAIDGAHPLTVDVLSAVEARQVLARRLGPARVAAEPAAIEDIITACAGLPLALSIAAARAVANPAFPLDAIAAELKRSRQSLDGFADADSYADVRSVFSWSYRTLSAPAGRLFRLLGLHPGPDIGVAGAASLAALDPAQARTVLAALVRANLAAENTPGRFALHDLLRAYAAELANEQDDERDRRTALTRLLDHYLQNAYRATLLLHPHQDSVALGPGLPGVVRIPMADRDAAADWFEVEYRALLAAIAQATVDGIVPHSWQLPWALTVFVDRTGRWHDWVDLQHNAADTAQRAGDGHAARARRSLARAYLRLGDHARAEAQLHQALIQYRERGDRVGVAHVHRTLGRVYARAGRYPLALEFGRWALAGYRAAGDRHGEARALNAIGWYLAHGGEPQRAVEHCQVALAMLREAGDRCGQAYTLDSLGYAYHHLGQPDEAVVHFLQAVDLYHAAGERFEVAETQLRLGDSYHAAGDIEAARDVWQRAMTVLESLGHPGVDDLRAKIEALDA